MKSLLALRGVGPESEAESVRLHGRRVTKVGRKSNKECATKLEQISSQLFSCLNPNAGDYSVLAALQPRVTFRYRAQPFHREILKG